MGSLYRSVLKPVFFKMDPETVHERVTSLGKSLGKNRISRSAIHSLYHFEHPSLRSVVAGIEFLNPIGLGAGFDKNAQLYDILPDVGFGFAELGSITAEKCAGNPKPRLFRLPEDKSIIVNYGLMNDGCEVISSRLRGTVFRIPIGISVAKTNDKNLLETEAGIRDYVKAYRHMHPLGMYTTINVSCPNINDGQTFGHPHNLRKLLEALNLEKHSKPVFLKLKPDFSEKEIEEIIAIAESYTWVTGFIVSNLTTHREGLHRSVEELNSLSLKGGLSGLPTQKRSLDAIRFLHARTSKIIIGCGGVFNGKDAVEKIKAGASLVQIVTALIFEGPGVVSKINKEVVAILQEEGCENIDELKKKYH